MRRTRAGPALAALSAAVVLATVIPLVAAAQGAATPQPTPTQPTAAQAGAAMYVIEQLVVNVYSAPGADAERVATLKSGDRVEVIERAGDAVHVRLGNGRDGWVRASYLTAAEPLRAQLAARSAEVTKLQADVTRLEGELRGARASPARAAASAAAAPQGATTATSATEPGQVRRPMLDAAPVIYRPRWRWLALSALVSLGIGFALGWWVLDRRIRAKYGGLRIY